MSDVLRQRARSSSFQPHESSASPRRRLMPRSVPLSSSRFLAVKHSRRSLLECCTLVRCPPVKGVTSFALMVFVFALVFVSLLPAAFGTPPAASGGRTSESFGAEAPASPFGRCRCFGDPTSAYTAFSVCFVGSETASSLPRPSLPSLVPSAVRSSIARQPEVPTVKRACSDIITTEPSVHRQITYPCSACAQLASPQLHSLFQSRNVSSADGVPAPLSLPPSLPPSLSVSLPHFSCPPPPSLSLPPRANSLFHLLLLFFVRANLGVTKNTPWLL